MKTIVTTSGLYEMNLATGKLELMKEGPVLRRGQKLYLGAKNTPKEIFAVIDPVKRTCVKVFSSWEIDEEELRDYQNPMQEYDKYVKSIYEAFGYNFYYAVNEDDFSDDIINRSILRASRLEEAKKAYDEKIRLQRLENKACLLMRYSYLKQPESRFDYKVVSGNLRIMLKHEFPGVKFSVKKRNGSDSVDIAWVDGPTSEQVEKLAKLFQGRTFDGMTDYEDFVDSDFIDLFGGLGYIFMERTYSDEIVEREKEIVLKDYPVLADGNDHKANQEGLYIPGYCAYWVNWRSLARFRLSSIDLREANETPTPDPTKGTRTNSSSYGDSEISQISGAVEIVDYSEKALAVFGETKEIKDQLKDLGGRFNPSLKHNGEKRAGWIFSKKQAEAVRELVDFLQQEQPIPEEEPETRPASYGDSGISQEKTNESVIRRGKSLQNIIDQTRRLNGYAGRNRFWSFKREKLINKIYTTYVANIQKLGAFSEPNKKFTKEEYTGIINEPSLPDEDRTESIKDPDTLPASYGNSEISPIPESVEPEPAPYAIEIVPAYDWEGLSYFDVSNAWPVAYLKVRADIEPGDIFNAYTEDEHKYGVTFDGVSLETSLCAELDDIARTECESFPNKPDPVPTPAHVLNVPDASGDQYIQVAPDSPSDSYGTSEISRIFNTEAAPLTVDKRAMRADYFRRKRRKIPERRPVA